MDYRSLPKLEVWKARCIPAAPALVFGRRLRFVQLHAHLSGSISRQCLHEIWSRKKTEGETTLEDPLVEMPIGKFDYDLDT